MKLTDGRSLLNRSCILVGLNKPGDGGNVTILDELSRLVDTAQGEILGRLTQPRDKPHLKHYLGQGKVEELRLLCVQTCAQTVVIDDPITPGQMRNLEKALDLPVMDRSELILDIFASHARSNVARLQVELALLKYSLPRLKRLWTHLDSQRGQGAGGGASRGVGEKQIEIDRRLVRLRIRELSQRQDVLIRRRQREVENREDGPRVALVGYTNAGKSTLMQRLTSSETYADDKLFATLDTQTRRLKLPRGGHAVLSDSVGFIQKLPHYLVDSFHATLAEVLLADLLLLVVDGSSDDTATQVKVVNDTLTSLGASDKPTLLVVNKIDCVSGVLYSPDREYRDVMHVSAMTGEGCDKLLTTVQNILDTDHVRVEIRFDASLGALYSQLEASGRIVSRDEGGESGREMRFVCDLTWAHMGQLKKSFPSIFLANPATDDPIIFPSEKEDVVWREGAKRRN